MMAHLHRIPLALLFAYPALYAISHDFHSVWALGFAECRISHVSGRVRQRVGCQVPHTQTL
jgi:hypothetical protein